MLVIRPFRGIIYSKKRVGDVSRVFAPPYDVISSREQDYYYRLHPYNIIRVILGKEEVQDTQQRNKYVRAAEFFRRWLSEGILEKEKIPSIYTYSQTYQVGGKSIKRCGFIALMKLEDFSSGNIFPHEEVFPEPLEDRFKLMLACRANFSAIFALFSDPEGKVDRLYKKAVPIFNFHDREGIRHALSAIRDKEIIRRICHLMQDKKIFIADGHHRYLTSLKLREKLKTEPSCPAGIDYVMVYFLNMDLPQVTILPVHRLVRISDFSRFYRRLGRISRDFYVKNVEEKEEEKSLEEVLSRINQDRDFSFGIYTKKEGFKIFIPRNSSLFIRQVKSAVFERILKDLLGEDELKKEGNIEFTTDAKGGFEKVKAGLFQIAFFLPPADIEEIKKVSLAGKKMPPKSTFFYPKLLSGIVIRDMEDAV